MNITYKNFIEHVTFSRGDKISLVPQFAVGDSPTPYVFMKPAKNAGTTIWHHYLKNNTKAFYNGNGGKVKKQWFDKYKNSTEVMSYYSFLFVRNPYDRVISQWKYMEPKLSFSSFLNQIINEKGEYTNEHYLPQHLYYEYKGTPYIDFLGRVENINDDWERLCKILKFNIKKLPTTNTTKHDHYSIYYDENTFNLVNQLYKRDIELFNYSFENE